MCILSKWFGAFVYLLYFCPSSLYILIRYEEIIFVYSDDFGA